MPPRKRLTDESNPPSNKKPKTSETLTEEELAAAKAKATREATARQKALKRAETLAIDEDQDEIENGKNIMEDGGDAVPIWQRLLQSRFPIIRAQLHALLAQSVGSLDSANRRSHAEESMVIYRQLIAEDPDDMFLSSAIVAGESLLSALEVDLEAQKVKDEAAEKKKALVESEKQRIDWPQRRRSRRKHRILN